MPDLRLKLRIQAPPALVYATLADFAAYPDFVPPLHEVIVGPPQPEGPRSQCLRLEVMARVVRDFRVVIEAVLTRPRRITWRRLEGDLRHLEGAIELRRADGGAAVDAEFRLQIESGLAIPPEVSANLAAAGFPGVIQRVKEHLESLARPRHECI